MPYPNALQNLGNIFWYHCSPAEQANAGEECLSWLTISFAGVTQYLEHEVLPQVARELTAMQSHCMMKERVLFYLESDKTLCVVLPISLREPLFNSLHRWKFGGGSKMHGEVSRQHWWPKIRTDIAKWCKACLVCATSRPIRAVKPLLTFIPVSGAFDQVEVDVFWFPKSSRGNQSA